jgi:transposase-like protein
MPLFLYNDHSVEIACPRCSMTAPKTIAWVRAHDRYRCVVCDFEFDLALDKRLAGMDRSSAIDDEN